MNTNWRPLTLSEILAQEQCVDLEDQLWPEQSTVSDPQPSSGSAQQTKRATAKAEQEWMGAIAALEHLIQQTLTSSKPQAPASADELPTPQGVIITAPAPVVSDSQLLPYLRCWTLTPHSNITPVRLPPCAQGRTTVLERQTDAHPAVRSLAIPADDPLANEQFCLVLTQQFSLVLVLGQDLEGMRTFQFSFDPATILKAWHAIGLRIQWASPTELATLTQQVQTFVPQSPDYKLVTQFSRLWFRYLPDLKLAPEPPKQAPQLPNWQSAALGSSKDLKKNAATPPQDVELLQAIAHEVRTPLTTIRTLVRMLLKRKTLADDVRLPLEKIDRECTQQIDRFNLFFQAVELETAPPQSSRLALTTTYLSDLIQQGIPRWQQQAGRFDQTLCVKMPKKMPTVVSNPAMLDQALTGLIEQFTRSLPQGSDIEILVTQAGHQLKLQLQASLPAQVQTAPAKPMFRALGKLLMLQPETGGLTLNRSVTKSLFQALGGKLIVRERPLDGETLTVYLPLGGTYEG